MVKAFDVFLNGKNIDTVFYSKNDPITADEVYDSLVRHDGYNPRIKVVEVTEVPENYLTPATN